MSERIANAYQQLQAVEVVGNDLSLASESGRGGQNLRDFGGNGGRGPRLRKSVELL
jgi:hypothetical protein